MRESTLSVFVNLISFLSFQFLLIGLLPLSVVSQLPEAELPESELLQPELLQSEEQEQAVDLHPYKQGNYVLVKLLKISKIEPCDRSAKKAIQFSFYIKKLPKASGVFTLVEPRDFAVNRQSYRKFSQALLGKYFEPHTSISTVASMKKRSSLFLLPTIASDDDYIVITKIEGARFPPGDRGRFLLEAGFNKKTDVFEFDFNLSALKKEQRDSVFNCK